MMRREFITLLGGAAAAWPLAARAQQGERMRRIGVLMNLAADDPESSAHLAAFLDGLQQLGWTDGRNVRIDTRWSASDPDRRRTYAAELVALAPDVILAYGGSGAGALQQATRTVPIVFAEVVDPVGAGLVASLARPGGNATGFSLFEYGISVKWLELLKQIVPNVTRAAVLRDPALTSGTAQLASIQGVAPSFGVELSPVNVHDAGEIDAAFATLRQRRAGALLVGSGTFFPSRRQQIVTLAARDAIPAMYSIREYVEEGGLVSYGNDIADGYRRAGLYVARILKGEKAGDLPVQAPTKFELVINLKTAKALGLEVTPTLLARADEVIE